MQRNVLQARMLVALLLATTTGLASAGENLVADPSFAEPQPGDTLALDARHVKTQVPAKLVRIRSLTPALR